MQQLSYAYEKLMVSIDALATSASSIQKRLEYAHSQFGRLQVRDFPPGEMQENFASIIARITTVKDPDRGYVPATTAQMSDDEASEVARSITELFLSVARVHLAEGK